MSRGETLYAANVRTFVWQLTGPSRFPHIPSFPRPTDILGMCAWPHRLPRFLIHKGSDRFAFDSQLTIKLSNSLFFFGTWLVQQSSELLPHFSVCGLHLCTRVYTRVHRCSSEQAGVGVENTRPCGFEFLWQMLVGIIYYSRSRSPAPLVCLCTFSITTLVYFLGHHPGGGDKTGSNGAKCLLRKMLLCR